MIFTTAGLLNYRLIMSIILCAFFIFGTVASLLHVLINHKNGVYLSFSLVCIITAILFLVHIFISYVDVCNPAQQVTRNWMLLVWNIIITIMPLSFILTGVQLVRSDR